MDSDPRPRRGGSLLWSKADEEILAHAFAEGLSDAEIAELLPERTAEAIRRHRVALGLSRHRRWTRDEDDALIRLKIEGLSSQEIAQRLPGRTLIAVEIRIYDMRRFGLLPLPDGAEAAPARKPSADKVFAAALAASAGRFDDDSKAGRPDRRKFSRPESPYFPSYRSNMGWAAP